MMIIPPQADRSTDGKNVSEYALHSESFFPFFFEIIAGYHYQKIAPDGCKIRPTAYFFIPPLQSPITTGSAMLQDYYFINCSRMIDY